MTVEETARKVADILNADSSLGAEIHLMGDQVNIVTPGEAFALSVRKFER